jgi:hypothetical protein
MGNNKKMITLIRNYKMTTNNSKGVEKGHLKHHGFILFGTIGGIEILRVEGIEQNVEGHQEIHKGHHEY